MGNFRKFIPIFPEISKKFVKEFFSLYIRVNYNHIKITNNHVPDIILDKQLSRSLCFHFMHYTELVLAWLPGILMNSNENYRHCNFQTSANISGNFRGNIKFPEILRSYVRSMVVARNFNYTSNIIEKNKLRRSQQVIWLIVIISYHINNLFKKPLKTICLWHWELTIVAIACLVRRIE